MFKKEEMGNFRTLYIFAVAKENDNKKLNFIYKDGHSLDVILDTAYETENDFDEDDPRYEEYFAMGFKNLETNELFEVSYHNLPEHVMCEDIKVY